jgi:hypothetical protein
MKKESSFYVFDDDDDGLEDETKPPSEDAIVFKILSLVKPLELVRKSRGRELNLEISFAWLFSFFFSFFFSFGRADVIVSCTCTKGNLDEFSRLFASSGARAVENVRFSSQRVACVDAGLDAKFAKFEMERKTDSGTIAVFARACPGFVSVS